MEEATGVQVCRRLRTRMYYVAGREHQDLRDEAPNAQYWCAKTAIVVGPDDIYCGPTLCQPGRSCFDSG